MNSLFIIIYAITMLEVRIKLDTREDIDLMNPPRLNAKSDIVLSQQRERDEFKRTVEDVKIVITDQVNDLTDKFRSYPFNSSWDLLLLDNGRQLFTGKVQRPITYDVKDDWINIRSYSKDRDFWDKAKVTLLEQVHDNFATSSDVYGNYISLESVIRINCDKFINDGHFKEYDIAANYASRKIRLSKNTSTVITTSEVGLYQALKTETTVFDLLTAFGKYYNAEFFIDPETDNLTMLQRNSILNDTEHNLDEIILNDEKTEYDDCDGKKYDYLHTGISMDKPTPLLAYQNYANPLPVSVYAYTNVYVGDIESEPCEAGGFAHLTPSANASGVVSNTTYAFVIPKPTSPDVIKQNLYVKIQGQREGRTRDIISWFKLYEFNPLTTYQEEGVIFSVDDGIFFRDTLSPYVQETDWINSEPERFIARKPSGHIWWEYDETTGTYEAIVGYDASSQPVGKIYDVLPKLEFYRGSDNTISSSVSEIVAFFGYEISLDTFVPQWQDFLIPKGKVSCSVKNTAYRIGDTFVTNKHPKIPAGKYVMKKGRHHLMQEKTEIELIQV